MQYKNWANPDWSFNKKYVYFQFPAQKLYLTEGKWHTECIWQQLNIKHEENRSSLALILSLWAGLAGDLNRSVYFHYIISPFCLWESAQENVQVLSCPWTMRCSDNRKALIEQSNVSGFALASVECLKDHFSRWRWMKNRRY